MGGYIDLHCHWIAGIDDGAPSVDESLALLRALRQAGFTEVVGTPHLHPAMFDATREQIVQAFERTHATLAAEPDLPALSLASEHHLDDLVLTEILAGRGLPYLPAGTGLLIEFPSDCFPACHAERFFDLRCRRFRPVLAHPERYRPVWRSVAVLDPIVDGGTLLLLDVAALSGHYGRAARQAATKLLAGGYYYAACSDAHRASDVPAVIEGLALLERQVGRAEADFMLSEGPRSILEGQVAD
jgi:protein-tyrosine phosphatase